MGNDQNPNLQKKITQYTIESMPKDTNPESPAHFKDHVRLALISVLTRDVGRLLLSLCLFAGGIVLLALRIPGWSLILGLPAVQIGIVFLIFTFDGLAQNKVGPRSLHIISCSVCRKATLTPYWQEEKICGECQKKIARTSCASLPHLDRP